CLHLTLVSPCSLPIRHLPSFPTRRSSDLVDAGKSEATAGTSSVSLRFADTLDDKLQDASPPQFAIYRIEIAGADGRTIASSNPRSEEHTSELQSRVDLVCRLLLEKKKTLI